MTVRYLPAMAVILIAVAVPAPAQLPENYLKRWDDPAVQQRIADGIEQNRMSDARLGIVDADGNPIEGAKVKVHQKTHDFLFGCNLFVLGQMEEKEAAYEEMYLRLFNFATIAFYWDDLEPRPGDLRFTEGSPCIWRRPPPDRAVAFGRKHGLTLKGHPLLWSNMTHNPDWMPKDADMLRERYVRRFHEIARRYAEDIPIWDGVNESLVAKSDFPLYSEESRQAPPFVPWAFHVQQELFRPENVMMINDVTSFNWPSDKSNRYYHQCTRLLEDEVPIEGIGFQFHFFRRQALDHYMTTDRCDPNALLDTYELFAELGLPLWISEITIGSAGEDGFAVQERVVRDLYRLWFSAPNMAGITWWNLGDGTAYGNEGIAGGGLADEDFKPKPAYQALDQLINDDWKTQLEAQTDSDGVVRFRGFHGEYDIEVDFDGTTRQCEFSLLPGQPATLTIEMQ